ncbi:hypothetical protein [Gluconobacter morbifer]|nr:hypothetical protein [Gluconobacter morbifer]
MDRIRTAENRRVGNRNISPETTAENMPVAPLNGPKLETAISRFRRQRTEHPRHELTPGVPSSSPG